jgi:hypothetical protein
LAVDKITFGDFVAIDQRAVERPEIADSKLAVRLENLAVLTAHERMGELYGTRAPSAEDRGQFQFEFLGAGSSCDHDKFRFHRPMIKPRSA